MRVRCLFHEMVSVEVLKTLRHEKNPNDHSKEQIKQLAKIMQYQGVRHPIVIARSPRKVMTKGHGRLESAIENGWHEFPVEYQDYDSEEMLYADVVADNAIAMQAELDLSKVNIEVPNLGPDFDIDWLGLKDFEIEPADKYKDKDADETPTVRNTNILRGDLYQLGGHRLLCDDSTDRMAVEKLMNGEKADMVYTDPPYGIKRDKGFGGFGGFGPPIARRKYKDEWDSTRPPKEVFDLMQTLAEKVIIFGGNFFADLLPQGKHWIVWDKLNTMPTFGDCELAWTNIDRTSVKKYTVQYNGLIGKETERFHPTQKPVKLHEAIFADYESKTVIDLYLGSGSTLIACEKTNRKCFGMEIDPQYCQVIIDRWEKFTGRKAVKLDENVSDQGRNTNAKMEEGLSVAKPKGKAARAKGRQRD